MARLAINAPMHLTALAS